MAQVSGMKLSLGISPARPPASRLHNPYQWMESFLPPALSQPYFFLDLKVICSHPVWGLWRELERAAGSPQVWTLPISEGKPREEAMGEGRGGGWQRDMDVHRGPRPTFIHDIVHKWCVPGWENKKACSAYLNHIAVVFPGQQGCFFFFFFFVEERQKQKWRNQTRVVVVLPSERLYMLHAW